MMIDPARMDWPRLVPFAILAASIGALIIAYTAELAFGIEPCILCLYQRIPYALAGALAVAALLAPETWGPRPKMWAVIGAAVLRVRAGELDPREVVEMTFDSFGKGGAGAPDWVAKVDNPDPYRGPFRGDTPETAAAYVAQLEHAAAALDERGLPPAAFLIEALPGCGGCRVTGRMDGLSTHCLRCRLNLASPPWLLERVGARSG